MKDFINSKLSEIANCVLRDEPDIDKILYINRLRLLYSTIICDIYDESDAENDCGVIIDQICSFESGQLCFTEANIDQYRKIMPNIAIEIFSTVAYGLAVEHLKGKDYFSLSEMLFIVYQELINSVETEIDKMTVSESLLDFNFASGCSEIMSLRLKRQWDAMR